MSNLIIKLNHILDPSLISDIVELVVDTNVYLPAMFSILIQDEYDVDLGTLKYCDEKILLFSVGTPVEITIEEETGSLLPAVNTVLKGEITSVEPVFQQDGKVFLKIRGYDRAHRLTYGKVTRTFGDGNPTLKTVSNGQIVSAVAANYGLVPDVDEVGRPESYIMQYNQSDWEFLWSRAEILGCQVYVDNRKLCFKKASQTRYLMSPTDLVWGRNLTKFEPRLSVAGTVTATYAYGWDPEGQKTVKSSIKSSSAKFVSIKESAVGGGKMHTVKFQNRPVDTIINPSVREAGQAKIAAQAKMDARESQFVRASGEVLGDPYLLAGTKVKIDGVGQRFSGTYYVTEAKHIIRMGVYTVRFQVSGRNPYTLRGLLNGSEQHPNNKITGVVVGVVTNLQDPENLGRVKVKFPWMPQYRNSEMESGWVRMAAIGGGQNRGIFFLPEISDEVLVIFEDGDVTQGYIIGVLWSKKKKPPEGTILDGSKQKVNQRIIRSRSGHVVILDDSQGAEKITITDKTGKNSIEINSKTNAMVFKSEGDFTIEAGGKFTVNSKGDVAIDSKAKLGLNATGQMNVKSQAKMALEGTSGANIKAGPSEVDLGLGGTAVKGTQVDVQASVKASVKGSAMVEIQGGLVKIN